VIALAIAVAALVVAAAVVVSAWRSQQRTTRRVVEVLERLGETTNVKLTSDTAIAQLSKSVDRVRESDDIVRVAEIRLERALDEIPLGIVVCDASGNVVARNSSSRVYAGARHGEALIEAATRDLIAAALTGTRDVRDLELHGPPSRSLHIMAAPLYADSELVGALGLTHDVTEQKRIDAVRRDFVANVSHELKTPLGALALLSDTLADETDLTVVKRLSGRLRDESLRVNRIVDELLTLSRIEGDGSPMAAVVPVHSVVAEAVARVRPAADHRDVTIDVRPVDPSTELMGDRTQLTSALFNLLDNAVKYSEPGSSVRIEVDATPSTVVLSVRDHGIGIPTRDLERIFERFYRVDKARSRDTGGTGLGLSIVRHVVQNHGGEVSVVSREGEGSTFTITIPRGES
jgi:two-component system sensor histidine kinase SenX3